MNLPQYIENAIMKAGKATAVNSKNSTLIREWLIHKKLIDEDFNNLVDNALMDFLIDSIESGIDGSQDLIEYLKNLEI